MEKIFYSASVGYSNPDISTTVEISEWRIYKETKKGYWVTQIPEYTNERNYKKFCKWIQNIENKSSLEPMYGSKTIKSTKQIAINSLHNRLKKRISWYKYWIEECEKGLQIIEENKGSIPEKKPYTMILK